MNTRGFPRCATARSPPGERAITEWKMPPFWSPIESACVAPSENPPTATPFGRSGSAPGLRERAVDGLEIAICSVEGAPRASKGPRCEQDETRLVPRFAENEEPLPGRTARAVEGEDETPPASARPRGDAQARISSFPQVECVLAGRTASAAFGWGTRTGLLRCVPRAATSLRSSPSEPPHPARIP